MTRVADFTRGVERARPSARVAAGVVALHFPSAREGLGRDDRGVGRGDARGPWEGEAVRAVGPVVREGEVRGGEGTLPG